MSDEIAAIKKESLAKMGKTKSKDSKLSRITNPLNRKIGSVDIREKLSSDDFQSQKDDNFQRQKDKAKEEENKKWGSNSQSTTREMT